MEVQKPPLITLGQWAYQAIKDLVRNNQLIPGQEVSIIRLTEILNISQTPVREAVARLNAEGYIEQKAHKKLRISTITQDFVKQVYRARKLLEPYLAAKVAARADRHPQIMDAARDIQSQAHQVMESKPEEVDFSLYLELDNKISELLKEDVRDELLGELMETVTERSLRIRSYAELVIADHPGPDHLIHEVTKEHLQIVEAILNRNPEQAKAFVLAHLENGERRTLNAVKHTKPG